MSTFRHLFAPHHTNNQKAKLLHTSSLSVFIGVFAVFQMVLGQITLNFPKILGYASKIPPEEIVSLTNLERKNAGLAQLSLNSKLSDAARQKASDMFAKNYWAHVSPSGTQPWYFITNAGYSYRYAGENLARDFTAPSEVVKAWMESPSHRENIINSRYQEIGVAVVDGVLEGRETTLVVQMFGTKLASAPQVGNKSATTVVSAKVDEAIPSVVPTPTIEIVDPIAFTSPFEITQIVGVSILLLLALVLAIDLIIISRKKIIRWTGRSLAHLIFIVTVIVAAFTILRGQII